MLLLGYEAYAKPVARVQPNDAAESLPRAAVYQIHLAASRFDFNNKAL